MHPRQAGAYLAEAIRRNAAEKKQRLKIRSCARLVGFSALHRLGSLGSMGGKLRSTQRQAKRRTDPGSHAGVIEKEERIPRVEQNCAQTLSRA
jgi:hypothetical protein